MTRPITKDPERDVPAAESFALQCRQTYPPHDIYAVLRRLRLQGRTGTLRLSLNMGGIAHIEFCEEHVIISDADMHSPQNSS